MPAREPPVPTLGVQPPRHPGLGGVVLTGRQLGGVQVVAGRGAQVGKRVDFGQEHPNLQGVGVGTVSGGAAAGAGAGVVPVAVPKAGAEAAGGVAAAAAAGAEGRGRVGGRLGALAAGGHAGGVRQRRGQRGGRFVGLGRQRRGTESL